MLAEGSVELALQSLLDNKTKPAEAVKEIAKIDDKQEQAKGINEDQKKDAVIADNAATPPTSPIRENINGEAERPQIVRSDSELALQLQRQWEEELRSKLKTYIAKRKKKIYINFILMSDAPQEYSSSEVKTAQQIIAEEVEKLKLVADNCGMFYDELSFPSKYRISAWV